MSVGCNILQRAVSSAAYRELVLVTPNGIRWKWVGHEYVPSTRAGEVRVERWTTPCRTCGRPFEVLAKLPAEFRRRYQRAKARALDLIEPDALTFPLPAGVRPPHSFELVNCSEHRWNRYPR